MATIRAGAFQEYGLPGGLCGSLNARRRATFVLSFLVTPTGLKPVTF